MMNALDRTQMLKFLSEQCSKPGGFGRDALARLEPTRAIEYNTYIAPMNPVASSIEDTYIPVVCSTGNHPRLC
jgi:hypothetical protein